MTGKVRLRLGNMFDGPSDLIVLPCSTAGTVTNFVEKTLRNFKIPSPRPGMNLGDVEIMPFTGAENVAQFVAFAASVESMSSISKAIERIGEQIGRFTVSESSVRVIAAPLLGAGAGGLGNNDNSLPESTKYINNCEIRRISTGYSFLSKNKVCYSLAQIKKRKPTSTRTTE